jgi:hypothetical protein
MKRFIVFNWIFVANWVQIGRSYEKYATNAAKEHPIFAVIKT